MDVADRKRSVGMSAKWLRTWPRRYAFALAAVAAATALRYFLGVVLGLLPPFVLFFPATIIMVALFAGFWPGIFATILSTVSVALFFGAPLSLFQGNRVRDIVGLGMFVGIGTTISALVGLYRRHEARLREFERAVEGLEEMIVVVDRDYRYVMANRAFLNYWGLKREQVVGRLVNEIFNPGGFEETVKQKLDECFRGKVVQYELRYRYPTRGERDLLISYFPIEGAGDERVASVLQDITDRKEAERSLKLFRSLIDQSSDAVEVVDPATLRFLDMNETACKHLGYSREEMLSLTVFDINPDLDEATRTKILNATRHSGSAVFESVHRRKDGSTFPVEVSLRCVPLDRKYMVVIARDISERRKAEDALRESEDRYRDLVEHGEDLFCTHDLEGRLLSVNPAPARVLGYAVAELLSMSMRELVAPEFRVKFDAYLVRIKTTGADKGLLAVLTRAGERRIWEYNNTLRTEGVNVPIVRGMARDVTEQKRAEQALRQREEDYRSFVTQSSEGIFRQDLDAPISLDLPEDEVVRRILHDSYLAECNDAIVKMYGLNSVQDFLGKRLTDTLDPNDPRNIALTRDYVRSGFRIIERESHEVDIHGNPKVFVNSMIGIVENGKLLRTWGIQRDITQRVKIEEARRKAEDALRASEAHFRILVEQAADGIFVADVQGKCLDVNSAGAEMFGYSRDEILGLSIPDVLAEEEIQRIASEIARLAEGGTIRSEWKFRRKDGSFFPGEVSGKQLPDGRLQGIIRDMTERKLAEETIRCNEERFRVALKDSPITVFNQDCDLRYSWIYNPQLYWQHAVLGKTDDEIIGAKKAEPLNELKRRVLKSGTALREEVTIAHNGRSYAFDTTIEPLFDPDGNVVGITGACMDIARLREMTDRLQATTDRLAQEKLYLESAIQTDLGFEEIIGQSPALRDVLKKARVVAQTDSTVLLLGETGTGKELVARSVHALSTRHDKTFIKLNCAAVPSGLLESELFGHEKGAFTGAVSQRVGRIELADKGTLFLDEIGELPLDLQPKLLRVLQDREFERLGGVRTLHVDVRIISATNRDLRRDVAEKEFREDLFYRLNVFPIQLPPLRDRRSDIPMLVHHFVRKHSMHMGRHIEVIPPETMAELQNWNWPGNIRELENMIERMVILSKGRVLAAPPAELIAPLNFTDDNLTEMERDHILRVLRDTNGVLSGTDGAASRLGIKRTTLQSMLKRFGIEPQEYRRTII